MTYYVDSWSRIWYQIWLTPPNLQSGTINVLQAENLNISQEWQIMLIHDVKHDIRDDPIIPKSTQEPSTSSKHDCVLDVLWITPGSWKSAYNSIMTYAYYLRWQIWYKKWLNPPDFQSGTINILQAWLCSWHTSIYVRELKFAYKLWIIYYGGPWCQKWQGRKKG